jgi:glutathione synthase/RimK-type ligase-like ATP-grasp enzyme
MEIHGTGKRDKDYLLLIDTLEQANIEYKLLPKDISQYNFTSEDFIFCNFGSSNVDFLLEQQKVLSNVSIYPSLETCKIYNKDNFNKFCIDNNLSTPVTFYNLEEINDNDFPLIFKPVSGSLSEHLRLCNNELDVLEQIDILNNDKDYENKDYILQKFIDTGMPVIKYRTIFIKDKILTYKKTSEDENIFCSLKDNGRIDEINPDNKYVDIISDQFIKIAKEHNIDFGALDIIQDLEGNCYLLELNGPTKLYRASQGIGINLYESIINYILTNQS